MKKIFSILSVFCLVLLQAQVISSSRWSDLFSYNNVIQIREDNGKLIAATENGIFFYTPSTGEITKLSKANGLHEVKISAFDYNPETKTGLVGYVNGTMDVIKPEGITYVVDIPLATGFTGSKKINHISISGNRAVISVDYGVSVFNLERKEFGDTCFFIEGGIYQRAKESVIKDNTVFAITDSGIKKHEINVTFPIYSGWSTALSGTFNHIDIENNVLAIANATQVQFGDGNTFTPLPQGFTNVKDVTVTPQNILVTDNTNVFAFGTTGSVTGNLTAEENLNSAWLNNGKIFAGSQLSGILDSGLKSFKPDGPYNNRSYKISLLNDKIWVSSGQQIGRYGGGTSPETAPSLGFYFFDGTSWIYPSYFKNNPEFFNLINVTPNPSDYKEVFFSNLSHTKGMGFYRMKYNETSKDFEFGKFYSTVFTSIWYDRPVGLTFDDKNNLFATTMISGTAENTGYGVYNRSADSFSYKLFEATRRGGVMKPLFYEGLLLIPIPRINNFGIVDTKNTGENLTDDNIEILSASSGLPAGSFGSLSVAVDQNGDAWIGTDNGLRVISNVADYKNAKAEPIIIEQNGIGEELFRDAQVIQIDVDSGNQKWISIDNGGVFYLTSSGQNTLQHFTKENSPIPNNTVTDIKVDNKTGKVYFVTLDGIVSYQGDVVNVSEKFGDVVVYPNPVVYANYKGNVKIKGLAEKTNIRITDTAGNLVHQAVARGGYYEWDLTNRGKRVASGIYFVLMTNENGSDKATAKIAVVN